MSKQTAKSPSYPFFDSHACPSSRSVDTAGGDSNGSIKFGNFRHDPNGTSEAPSVLIAYGDLADPRLRANYTPRRIHQASPDKFKHAKAAKHKITMKNTSISHEIKIEELVNRIVVNASEHIQEHGSIPATCVCLGAQRTVQWTADSLPNADAVVEFANDCRLLCVGEAATACAGTSLSRC